MVTHLTPDELVSSSIPDLSSYHENRVENGVPEGVIEIPPGQLFPFELNLDYLQGGVV